MPWGTAESKIWNYWLLHHGCHLELFVSVYFKISAVSSSESLLAHARTSPWMRLHGFSLHRDISAKKRLSSYHLSFYLEAFVWSSWQNTTCHSCCLWLLLFRPMAHCSGVCTAQERGVLTEQVKSCSEMCCEQMLSVLGLFSCYTARIAFAELAVRCTGDSFSAPSYCSSLAL